MPEPSPAEKVAEWIRGRMRRARLNGTKNDNADKTIPPHPSCSRRSQSTFSAGEGKHNRDSRLLTSPQPVVVDGYYTKYANARAFSSGEGGRVDTRSDEESTA